MKKTTVTYKCDDCGRTITDDNRRHNHRGLDMCHLCVEERLAHSFVLVPMPRTCPSCKGKGEVKMFYGSHKSDFNMLGCMDCDKTGRIPLS